MALNEFSMPESNWQLRPVVENIQWVHICNIFPTTIIKMPSCKGIFRISSFLITMWFYVCVKFYWTNKNVGFSIHVVAKLGAGNEQEKNELAEDSRYYRWWAKKPRTTLFQKKNNDGWKKKKSQTHGTKEQESGVQGQMGAVGRKERARSWSKDTTYFAFVRWGSSMDLVYMMITVINTTLYTGNLLRGDLSAIATHTQQRR